MKSFNFFVWDYFGALCVMESWEPYMRCILTASLLQNLYGQCNLLTLLICKTPVDLIIWQIYVMNGHPEQLWPAAKSANYSILKCAVIMWLCSLPLWGPSLYLRLAVMIPLVLYLRLAIRAAVYEWNGGKPEGDGGQCHKNFLLC